MLKGSPVTHLKSYFRSKSALGLQLEKLRAEVSQLESRLASAQQAKVVAENRVEELRKDKDRMRAKVAEQKKVAEQAERVAKQLSAKCENLEKTIEELQS